MALIAFYGGLLAGTLTGFFLAFGVEIVFNLNRNVGRNRKTEVPFFL